MDPGCDRMMQEDKSFVPVAQELFEIVPQLSGRFQILGGRGAVGFGGYATSGIGVVEKENVVIGGQFGVEKGLRWLVLDET